jgi:SAM-dependent methyltransferase
MQWEDFLADRTHNNLYVSSLVYMPTIKMIRRIARPGEFILEAGCGSGRIAMLLADMGYKTVALDNLYPLLNRIKAVTDFLPDLHIIHADMTAIPFKDKTFKVTYSCGVLEHFDPDDIIKFLEEQRRVSTHVIVDVPNEKCRNQAFGDERFYSDGKWSGMFYEAGLEVKQILHRGLDKGMYIGNCSILFGEDREDNTILKEEIDVYDHY